jgi:hypothetical protein
MCPWSALPPHLNTPEKVELAFPDDSTFGNTGFGYLWKRFQKIIKPWIAFGPRATEWWARWRMYPTTLFAAFGQGESRWENDIMAIRSVSNLVVLYKPTVFYLSRIQYWCDWSIQLQWPLFFACHFKYGRKGLVYFYIGAKRDTDRVYWFPDAYIGTVWK